jgi:hypothetical protein
MSNSKFAVCLSNEGYPASLEPRKLYEILDDPQAASKGLLRVIDESGEDYLYPARMFALMPIPEALADTLHKLAA